MATLDTRAAPAPDRLPMATRLGWGLGSFPMAAISLASGPLLLRYMTDTLGIAAAVAATLYSVAKIWDAIVDPTIGHFSDRINTRWGRRLPCMLVGGLLSTVLLVMTFTTPVSTTLMPAFLLVMMMAFALTYSLFMIPYMTMPSEITTNYHGRSQLMSFRVVFNSAGSFIGSGLAPMMLAYWGATRVGHMKMAGVVALIAAFGILLCVFLLRNAPRSAPPPREEAPFFKGLVEMVKVPPFAYLLLSKITYFLTLAFTLSALPFFTKHVMRIGDNWLGTILICQTAALILSQPFWLRIARMFDKRNGYMMAATLFALSYLSYWITDAQEPIAITLVRAVCIGFAGGGTFLLTQAMLPDVMEYDRITSGKRREGMFAGVFVMVEQIAGAIGIAIFGWTLSIYNYTGALEGALVSQPREAILALRICVTIIPAALVAVSILVIMRYRITGGLLAELREQDARLS